MKSLSQVLAQVVNQTKWFNENDRDDAMKIVANLDVDLETLKRQIITLTYELGLGKVTFTPEITETAEAPVVVPDVVASPEVTAALELLKAAGLLPIDLGAIVGTAPPAGDITSDADVTQGVLSVPSSHVGAGGAAASIALTPGTPR